MERIVRTCSLSADSGQAKQEPSPHVGGRCSDSQLPRAGSWQVRPFTGLTGRDVLNSDSQDFLSHLSPLSFNHHTTLISSYNLQASTFFFFFLMEGFCFRGVHITGGSKPLWEPSTTDRTHSLCADLKGILKQLERKAQHEHSLHNPAPRNCISIQSK